jgi:hypothetical protein
MYRLMYRAVEDLLFSFGWTSEWCFINSHSMELTASQLVKKFPAIYGTRTFIFRIHERPPPVVS